MPLPIGPYYSDLPSAGNLKSGTVNTATGGAVTRVSGSLFDSSMSGQPITINAVVCTFTFVTTGTGTVSPDPGNQTNVAYEYGAERRVDQPQWDRVIDNFINWKANVNGGGFTLSNSRIAGCPDAGSQVFNVKAYGAAGTGLVDDTSAIQAALTAGAGAEVVLPPGTYNVNGSLTVPSGTWVRGSKHGATIINAIHATADLFVVTGTDRVTISDMYINGVSKTAGWAINVSGGVNFTTQNLFVVGMPFGVRLSNVATAIVNDCEIRELQPNTGIGICSTDASIEVRINDVIMDNVNTLQPLAGIQVDDSPYTQISKCEIIRCGWNLLVNPQAGQSVIDLTVFDSLFDGPVRAPVAFLPNGNGTPGSALIWRAKFSNVWCSGAGFFPIVGDNPLSGVTISPTNGGQAVECSFRGCTIPNNRQAGMNIEGGADTFDLSIEDCYIVGNSYPSGGTAGTFPAILIGVDVSHIKISNNVLGTNMLIGGFAGYMGGSQQTQSGGVQVAAGASDYLTITGNIIPGSTFVPIFISLATGLNMIVENNSPVDTSQGTIASATSVGLSGQPFTIYDVTGTTNIATLLEGWIRRRILVKRSASGSVSFVTGGNIAKARTLSQGDSALLTFDGTLWWWA